ncbi:MAG: hypothetical protein JSV80_08520 [Acidobacteriota bacterium]|nr:MAG: hypothetical protein JSV80_08520 [Acidobacteriota bacterium]
MGAIVLTLIGLTGLGCATSFSPEMIRAEIVRQRGEDPLSVFEFTLGRFTTLLLQGVLAVEGEQELPFAGLQELQLAVYEAPSDAGPALDVTLIPVRGWERVVQIHDASRSGTILVRSAGADVADLVVVGASARQVVYGRLSGRLSRELPAALGEVLREGGPDEVRRVLTKLTEDES